MDRIIINTKEMNIKIDGKLIKFIKDFKLEEAFKRFEETCQKISDTNKKFVEVDAKLLRVDERFEQTDQNIAAMSEYNTHIIQQSLEGVTIYIEADTQRWTYQNDHNDSVSSRLNRLESKVLFA